MSLLRIGDLARLGGVSVRMLRHYHEIGLLVPDHTDEVTGYRYYNGDRLETLRQIVTLRDLGLSLAETHPIVHGQATAAEIKQILLTRRQEASDEVRVAQAIVERIDTYLKTLARGDQPPREKEGTTMIEVEIKQLEARLVAQLSATAESWAPSDIGPVIQPLYPELIARMNDAGVEITGPSTAWYEDTTEGQVLVHATLEIVQPPASEPALLGFEVAELPALGLVASTIHRGSMASCDTTYEALLNWIEKHKFTPLGHGREVDVVCGPDGPEITELQIPIEPAEESE